MFITLNNRLISTLSLSLSLSLALSLSLSHSLSLSLSLTHTLTLLHSRTLALSVDYRQLIEVPVIFSSESASTQCVDITIFDDQIPENDENFQVTIRAISDFATVGQSTSTVTITENDGRCICV